MLSFLKSFAFDVNYSLSYLALLIARYIPVPFLIIMGKTWRNYYMYESKLVSIWQKDGPVSK